MSHFTTFLVLFFLASIFVVLAIILRRKYNAVEPPNGFEEVYN